MAILHIHTLCMLYWDPFLIKKSKMKITQNAAVQFCRLFNDHPTPIKEKPIDLFWFKVIFARQCKQNRRTKIEEEEDGERKTKTIHVVKPVTAAEVIQMILGCIADGEYN